MKTPLLLTASLLITVLCIAFTQRETPVPEYLGQRCPPDMEFIPGNDSIPAFFIGKSQETNMNYVLYLDWLGRTFVSYPEVAKQAEPQNSPLTELHRFNDPAVQYSLWHPALAYYPVTGLDWQQVQDYLQWKTDRMNEYIMFSIWGKEHYKDRNIINENNFNTEAFIAQQYTPYVAKKNHLPYLFDDPTVNPDKQSLSATRPYFFTGLRLPTEEEFEYACRERFINKEPCKHNTSPYGSAFYMHFFIQDKPTVSPIDEYFANISSSESAEQNRIKGAGAKNAKAYGVYNMGNNVKEWMMDIYTPAKKHYTSYESIFYLNGHVSTDSVSYIYDQYGQLAEKDSLGRMRFRIMGVKANGNDLRIYTSGRKSYYSYLIHPRPDSLAQIEASAKHASNQYMRTHYNRLIQYIKDGLTYTEYIAPEHKDEYSKHYDSVMAIFKKEFRQSGIYSTITIPYIDSAKIKCRVVKSGTWKHPSVTAREKTSELSYSSEVGFRCVMQYNGFPVQKKYRIRW